VGKLVVAALVALAVGQPGTVTVQSDRLKFAGGEIAFDTVGSGPAVVFLHGGFLDRHAWDPQMAAFAKQFRVIRYDIRPFGESSTPKEAYNTPEDLVRLLDHLKVDRAHLIGHSFGGGVALDFALQQPDRVNSLTLVAAPPGGFVPPQEELKQISAIFAAVKEGDDAIVKAWLDHPMWSVARTRPALVKEIETITRRNLAPFRLPSAPYIPMKPAAIDRLSEVKVPTLVILGDRDMPSIKQAAEVLTKGIQGAHLKIVPGADHALPLGWAEEFNAAVLGFISSARR
jgi:pimeloyl-ACP methyl ester carboxylesterase